MYRCTTFRICRGSACELEAQSTIVAIAAVPYGESARVPCEYLERPEASLTSVEHRMTPRRSGVVLRHTQYVVLPVFWILTAALARLELARLIVRIGN